jgi:DNA polymerase-3 subunit delta'
MPEPPVISFAAVRGHERVRDFLRTAVARGRLAHALLFAGPDGVGKRSLALAFGAWMQCEAGGDDACGACASCRQVAAGSHPDLQVVAVAPGKKEIGVDRIRALKRFTQIRSSRGTAKVGIIDDAHMLTVAAQNALLKTLEEPPDRCLLIVVAHNPDALLPTVRSRCQRIQFFPLPADAVADLLAVRHGIEAGLAREAALLAEGSPGRALALSAGLAGGRGEQLRQQLATLGTARYVRVMQLAEELRHPDRETSIKLEALLSQYRADALRSIGAGHLVPGAPPPRAGTPLAVRAALERVDAVRRAWNAVRRGNPNRQLLLEALLLRLTASQ